MKIWREARAAEAKTAKRRRRDGPAAKATIDICGWKGVPLAYGSATACLRVQCRR